MSKTSPRITRAEALRQQALTLRRGGASFQSIANQLGVSKSTAHKAVSTALAALREQNDELAKALQTLEADRLDVLQLGIWTDAARGDLAAIQTVLRIMERRARLLGLDAPTKVAPTSPQGDQPYQPGAMSAEERRARIAELEAKRNGGRMAASALPRADGG